MSFAKTGELKKRIKSLTKIKWDLVIFDEVHYGEFSGNTEKIFSELKYKKRLDLSGTPFRLLEHIDFCKEQIFTYSYLDEQENKKKENKDDPQNKQQPIYRAFPDLKISTIDITQKDINSDLEKYYNKDLEFSLNRLFEASKGIFINEEAVDSFLSGLCKDGLKSKSISVYGALSNPSRLALPQKRHSIWWVDSIATAKAFVQKLKNHDYFKNFEIISASGIGKRTIEGNIEKEEAVITKELRTLKSCIKKSIEDENSKGTITITVKRFLTGVTVEEWDSILILNDIEAPEDYYQAIFRVQSPWQGSCGRILKPRSWVFDFSVSRCLIMKRSISNVLGNTKSYENEIESLDNICRSFFLEKYVGGNLDPIKISPDDILSVLNTNYAKNNLGRRIASEALVFKVSYETLKNNPHLERILRNIKGYRKQVLNSRSILKKIGPLEQSPSIKRKIEKKEKNLNEVQKKIIWTSEQIIKLSISMTDFIYMTRKREECIDDVMNTNKWQLFKAVTGISKKDFKKLCKIKIIKQEKLNQIVRDFRGQEIFSLKTEEFIYKEISRLAS